MQTVACTLRRANSGFQLNAANAADLEGDLKRFAIAAALLTLSTSCIFADALPTNSSWVEFQFGGVNSFATVGTATLATTNPVANQTIAPPWTFSGPAVVRVLDLFDSVDRFAVFDNNVLLGDTSAPTSGGVCNNNIGCALADSRYSFGAFNVGAGSHSITVQAIVSPTGSGAAVLNATATAVPEPGSVVMVFTMVGILGYGAGKKRLRKNSSI